MSFWIYVKGMENRTYDQPQVEGMSLIYAGDLTLFRYKPLNSQKTTLLREIPTHGLYPAHQPE